jgi:hypothetical protein
MSVKRRPVKAFLAAAEKIPVKGSFPLRRPQALLQRCNPGASFGRSPCTIHASPFILHDFTCALSECRRKRPPKLLGTTQHLSAARSKKLYCRQKIL